MLRQVVHSSELGRALEISYQTVIYAGDKEIKLTKDVSAISLAEAKNIELESL